MNKIKGNPFIVSMLLSVLLVLLISAGTAGIAHAQSQIVDRQHLVQIDQTGANVISVTETIIFRNEGTNFTGMLRTWVPDGASQIRIVRVEMRAGGQVIPIQFNQDGNIISWFESLNASELSPLYELTYSVQDGAEYSKTLVVTGIINYRIDSLIFKVVKKQDYEIKFKDESGEEITPENSHIEDGALLGEFTNLDFKEIHIEFVKSSAGSQGLWIYIIIGAVIVLLVSYPILRNRSRVLRSFEDKIKRTGGQGGEEESEEEREEEGEEEREEESRDWKSEELERKELERKELELKEKRQKKEITEPKKDKQKVEKPEKQKVEKPKKKKQVPSPAADRETEPHIQELKEKIKELEKKYAAGEMMDEEYEEKRAAYEKKIRELEES